MKNMKFLKNNCLYAICAIAIYLLTGCTSFTNKEEATAETAPTPENEIPNVTGYKTPQNIDLLKQELKAYYYSGGYDKAMEQVGYAALEYLKSCKDMPGRLAIVLDVDGTAVSDYKNTEEMDFSFNVSKYDQYIRSARATVIQPTLKLTIQAKKQGVAVVFVSGRKEEYRDVTTSNLKRLGYDNITKLIMRPSDLKPVSVAEFKLKEREKLIKEGYRIILVLGDQYSDFQGGFYDKGFKYPNPFYYVP
jgi:predicted secreted acid phosphatase